MIQLVFLEYSFELKRKELSRCHQQDLHADLMSGWESIAEIIDFSARFAKFHGTKLPFLDHISKAQHLTVIWHPVFEYLQGFSTYFGMFVDCHCWHGVVHGAVHRFETLPVERRVSSYFPARRWYQLWRRWANLLVQPGSFDRTGAWGQIHTKSYRNWGSKLPVYHGFKSNVTRTNNHFQPFLEVSSQHWRIELPENKPEAQPFCRRKRHQVLHWCWVWLWDVLLGGSIYQPQIFNMGG